ncbi:MAG: hypothetical protein LUG13_04445 [Oscillospiraceae bacterium]|nr:hypothetical protein [Oscillospiraceae bacterium]
MRKLMFAYNVTQTTLADIINRSTDYVSKRMLAHKPWDMDDIYAIADYFNDLDPDDLPMPYEDIAKYFPPRKASKKGWAA